MGRRPLKRALTGTPSPIKDGVANHGRPLREQESDVRFLANCTAKPADSGKEIIRSLRPLSLPYARSANDSRVYYHDLFVKIDGLNFSTSINSSPPHAVE